MDSICIVGAACRLPGAPDEASFRDVLNRRLFTVGPSPRDRWNPDLLYHPDPRAAGAAYTFAGGFLPSPYDFDIGVFGMSPREAMQLDPQQRLLAEVVWEALEDARIAPTAIAGQEVGVYIGVSALDHANLFGGDPGAIESHFMTGNTLSIVANRISYLFDFKGPSVVIDTACSASLVAVDRALADLRSGRIDTAVVGGVNMLLSPAAFVGFSRAAMLSPTGACRPFSGQADGYVRAEGAVVFVLRREDAAAPGSIRAFVAGSAVNSDGRTAGIALPGLGGQRALLERAYADAGIAPEEVAFVEAHGTGTVVGDPVEANALGEVLGRHRTRPLPIGSVKSNIGHLEPASGVAGMMKALIALEQRRLPATLHLATLNPHIPFDALNVQPAVNAVDLGKGELHCGVSSFGFGGTNAHVILSSAPGARRRAPPKNALPETLILSAHCKEALAELGASAGEQIAGGVDPARLAGAVLGGRALMRQRAVMPLGDPEAMADALRGFSVAGQHPAVTTGSALGAPPAVCFVYNGNGSQWVGMGRAAHVANPTFARAFDEADEAFRALGLDPLSEALHAEDLAERMGCAACAQPLIFAIQAGVTTALAERGLRPSYVLGHSVGEIGAAHAAGVLDLAQAARILAARAHSQEMVRGVGGMATLAASRGAIIRLIEETGLPDLCIAADNGPGSVTVSGRQAPLEAFLDHARRQRIPARRLNVEYPYHSPLLDGIRGAFLAEAGILSVRRSEIAMISTVTGEPVGERRLESPYWWQNIRHEVLFRQAVTTAAGLGANIFLEIGPRAILASAIAGSIEEAGLTARVLPTLTDSDKPDRDPIAAVLARAIANGAAPASTTKPLPVDRSIRLPHYPWQRQTYRYTPTSSAIDIHGFAARHPLIGARVAAGSPEWRTVLDAQLVPYLADHVIGGEIVVPATALAEMALAAARELWPAEAICVEDFDIVQAMVLPAEGQREVSVRYAEAAGIVEIYNRPRFGGEEWTLCARGRVMPAQGTPGEAPEMPQARITNSDGDAIYRRARESGIDYGPAFRLLETLRRADDETIEVALAAPDRQSGRFGREQVLHPATLDAAFHGLFDLLGAPDGKTWLPIRFERLSVWRDTASVTAATIVVNKSNEQLKTVTLWLRDANGATVARLDRALLRAVTLSQTRQPQRLLHLSPRPAGLLAETRDLLATIRDHFDNAGIPEEPEGWLLLRAHMRAAAHQALRGLADDNGRLDIGSLLRRAQSALGGRRYLAALLGELTAAGLVEERGGEVQLAQASGLPEPEAILATVANECPLAAADLALSAQAAAQLPQILAQWDAPPPRAALLERSSNESLRICRACDALLDAVRAMEAAMPGHRLHVVVAERGAAAIIAALTEWAAADRLRLSLLADDENAAERLSRRIGTAAGVEIVDISRDQFPTADIALMLDPSSPVLTGAAGLLREGGVLLAAELADDHVTVFQQGPHSAGDRSDAITVAETMRAEAKLQRHATLGDTRNGLVLHAAVRRPALFLPRATRLCIVRSSASTEMDLEPLLSELERGNIECLVPEGVIGLPAGQIARNVLYLVDEIGTSKGLAEVLSDLRRLVTAVSTGSERPQLWIGAVAGNMGGAAQSAAIRAFARVALNERIDRDIRFVEIAAGTTPAEIGRSLVRLMASAGEEREFHIGPTARQVPRVMPGLPLTPSVTAPATAAELQFPRPGMLESFQWSEAERLAPGPFEVQVEVAATGLNFRDVMLAMGLLSDDVLDEGLAGAVYGLECAGRVTALGSGVSRHRIGDIVVGFGMSSFATHVVAPQDSFAPLPVGLPITVAAGIPVAFTTAWYALVELARLAPGERVLIHGGAGAVGLAAIQIASRLGAEVITTVSSPDKEAIARLYGAAHVYDSRSLAFVDAVRDRHGGADVVLNSLAGDAMRGSLKCLRPRGRFVELGKRDYVANSVLGLRPFRRNLSYFGVDVDQLLALDPALVTRALRTIMAAFEDGSYLPLPTTVYRAAEIGEAFRLMQNAGHIGKIVITPPPAGTVAGTSDAAPFTPGDAVQLVVGGTRGFGLATALWLAERGATRVVVASLTGEIEPGRQPAVDALRERGVTFAIERLDVTDEADVARLVTRVTETHGPIGGVYHTAVRLEDGLIDGLTDESLARVLAPKVQGAINLDRATRGQPVAQFVLFSSAAALIGNPGQGAYAAANGYLEGLARARRAEGLPALAVAWGAITDVGLLAGRADTAESLTRVAGLAGMTSHEALDELGKILPLADRLADPVVACVEFAASGVSAKLPVAASPAFASMFAKFRITATEEGGSLAELIAGKKEIEAHRIVAGILVDEVAHILRLAVQDIDLDASVDSLGMDSLMALELRMSIETRHRVTLPVMAISATGSLRELAHRILLALRQEAPQGDSSVSETESALLAIHGAAGDPGFAARKRNAGSGH